MAALLSTSTLPTITASTRLALNFSRCGTAGQSSTTTLGLFAERSLPGLNENTAKENPFLCLSVKVQTNIGTEDEIHAKIQRKSGGNLVLSEGRDGDDSYGFICPGCGVYMQSEDPNLPGYYKKRKAVLSDDFEEDDYVEGTLVDDFDGDLIESDFEVSDEAEGHLKVEDNIDSFDWDSEEWEGELNDEEKDLKELDGFAPAGVGYGNITWDTLKEAEKKKVSKAERKRLAREAEREKEEVTVCARCHSLRNYGQVKNQMVENLMPDFDFDRLISTRLMKPTGNADATIVVMVVDCVDFDGSFPKRAARSLFEALEGNKNNPKGIKRLPKLVLVATKVDLLPSQVSPTRLDRWVRHRAKALGAPKLSRVYLVSAKKDMGVRNLLSFIKESAGPRGNVWIIGAQNAGKSTLINTFAKKGGAKITRLTEASVPGTTLGILRIGGILSGKAKMYDTPGLIHPYLMSMRLSREEQKMAEMRKELQPRTYRMKVSQTVHVGGLMRLDLCLASVETIYMTIWASPNVSLHLGKTENADEIWRKHVGVRLQPPIGTDRVAELGSWEEREFKVTGTSWDVNAADIAVAGFGWYSMALKGNATLKMWTYEGIEVHLREPLVLDRAQFLERPGFWLPKALSGAIGSQTELETRRRKQPGEESERLLFDATV